MKSNIVLIGMPGSGKSTAGVILAKMTGLSFVDTDLLIQSRTGKLLQQIIDEKGTDEFIRLEGEIIASLEFENSVIATGGSAVLTGGAMKNLKQGGTVVYLKTDLADICRRITNLETRGIAMQSGETLGDIYKKREPLYRKYADITVSGSAAEETAREIIKKLNL